MNKEHIHNEPKLVRPLINKLLVAACIFIFINVLIAGYSIYEFYYPSQESFCAINDLFSCATVAQTDYAVFLGLPVAIWGFAFYSLLFIGTLGVLLNWPFWKIYKKLRPQTVLDILRYLSYFGILFSLYLTYAEAFVIHVFCPLCLAQQVIVIIIAALYIWANKKINKGKEETKVCEFC